MDATKKDLVLRKIQEHEAITRGALSGKIRLKKEEVESIAKALEAEGKIKAWPGKRSDSMIYTTPDLPNPMEEIDGKKPPAKKKAAPSAAKVKRQRNVNKHQTDTSLPKPDAAGSSPPKNGGGRVGSAGTNYAALGDLHNSYASLVSALIEKDQAGIDGCLDDIALAAMHWRRERRAAG